MIPILAVIPGVPVVAILLAYIGAVSLLWTVVHGRYLWRQWREEHVRPGTLGGGLWAMFASMGAVCLVAIARRALPDVTWLRAVTEAALLGVAVTVTWLAVQLLRLWR